MRLIIFRIKATKCLSDADGAASLETDTSYRALCSVFTRNRKDICVGTV
jgi:hypothetical protein